MAARQSTAKRPSSVLTDEEFIAEVFYDSDSDASFDGFDNDDRESDQINSESEGEVDTEPEIDYQVSDQSESEWRVPTERNPFQPLIPPFTGVCGLQSKDLPEKPTELDFFNLFFADSDLQFIADETNRYAAQIRASGREFGPNSRIFRWHDVTITELRRFFALILAMGLVKKNSYPGLLVHRRSASNSFFWQNNAS